MTVPGVTTTISARVRADIVGLLWSIVGGCPGNAGDCPHSPCYASDARAVLRELGEHCPEPTDDDEDDET